MKWMTEGKSRCRNGMLKSADQYIAKLGRRHIPIMKIATIKRRISFRVIGSFFTYLKFECQGVGVPAVARLHDRV